MPTETARSLAESNYNNLRAIIHAYLNTKKKWIVNDLRKTDPMDVDFERKSKSKSKSKSKEQREKQRSQPKQKQKQEQQQRQRQWKT